MLTENNLITCYEKSNNMSPSEFKRIRQILFCTVHDPCKGFSCAYDYLENYKNKPLDNRSYVGLKAELDFYKKHGREFRLTVAGDMGEHADFSGIYGSMPVRFDVTTNIDFKDFDTYEPYMGQGIRYKIALLDTGSFDVIDVFDLGFDKCRCGGYLIPIAVLLDQNYNQHGEAQWCNDQLLMRACTSCNELVEDDRVTHHGLFSPSEFANGIEHEENEGDLTDAVQQYRLDTYKFLRREFNDYLMAIGEHGYKITNRGGDGYWAVDFTFCNNAVASDLPYHIERSHEL